MPGHSLDRWVGPGEPLPWLDLFGISCISLSLPLSLSLSLSLSLTNYEPKSGRRPSIAVIDRGVERVRNGPNPMSRVYR